MEIIKANPKTMDDINKEYSHWCSMAGDLQYKIMCYKGELEVVNNKLREINQEAGKIKKETSDERLAKP